MSGILISVRIFQFVVIHIVKGFSVVNESEVDVFLKFSGFFYDLMDVGIKITANNKCWEGHGEKETPGVTGKFGLGVQNEAGQKLIEFSQENTLVIANTLLVG